MVYMYDNPLDIALSENDREWFNRLLEEKLKWEAEFKNKKENNIGSLKVNIGINGDRGDYDEFEQMILEHQRNMFDQTLDEMLERIKPINKKKEQ